ncbi:MAG TPA: hypothetical protein VFD05_00690 [Bacilli bacterium]|nr:hypothetical protein [Bacilli bacterium]
MKNKRTKKRYYLITCKFGHVGRDKYLPLVVPVKARDAKEASDCARNVGGVKKNHKDWCLEEPREVDEATFSAALEAFRNDPYWDKKTRSNKKLFRDRLVDEPNYTRHRGIKTNTVTFKKPTSRQIKSYHRKRSKVRREEYENIIRDNEEYDEY